MSSVPLPELPSLSNTPSGPEPATAASSQAAETNSQFSSVLEGEQAALDAEDRSSPQEHSANSDKQISPETPVSAESEQSDGNALPLIAGLEGIVVARPVTENVALEVQEGAEVLKAQAAVVPSSDVSATLNRLTSATQPGVQSRPDVTIARLLHTGPTMPAVPVNEVSMAASEPLNNLSAAVHRAVQSEALPGQANTSNAPSADLPAAVLMTAQFAAVQAFGDDASTPTPTMTLANAAAATAMNTGVSATATNSGLPATTLDVPFRQAGWDGALGERVVWMVNQKLQAAEIKLNPPQLGPIEVRINIHNDQAQVTFTAQHANVREALEAAIPRLKDMFGGTGLDLVDVGVSQQSFAQREGAGSRNASKQSGSVMNDVLGSDDSSTIVTRQSDLAPGLIDLFA